MSVGRWIGEVADRGSERDANLRPLEGDIPDGAGAGGVFQRRRAVGVAGGAGGMGSRAAFRACDVACAG